MKEDRSRSNVGTFNISSAKQRRDGSQSHFNYSMMRGVAHDARSVLQNHRNSIISLEVLICNVTLVRHVLKTLYVCVVLVRGSVEINHKGRRSSLRTFEDRKKRLSCCLLRTSVVSDIFCADISVFILLVSI